MDCIEIYLDGFILNFFGSMNLVMVDTWDIQVVESVIVFFYDNFSLTIFLLVQYIIKQQRSNNNQINKFNKLFVHCYFSLIFYHEYYIQRT
jgi:hypothetical protein